MSTDSSIAFYLLTPNGLSFTATEKGFMTGKVALDWLKNVFDLQTKEQAEGGWRLPLLDGHSYHCSAAFLHYALEHQIAVLAYPPHYTHALQGMFHLYILQNRLIKCLFAGLDVCGFGPFKAHLIKAKAEHAWLCKGKINKTNILNVISKAFTETFTPATIKQGFELTGIVLFNPAIITPAMMAPSQLSLSLQIFPGEDFPEVKSLVAAFAVNWPTSTLLPPITTPPAYNEIRHPLGTINTNIPHPSLERDTAPIFDLDATPDNAWIAIALSKETPAAFLFDPAPLSESSTPLKPQQHHMDVYKIPPILQVPLIPSHMKRSDLDDAYLLLQMNLHLAEENARLLHTLNQKINVQLTLQHEHLHHLTSQLFAKNPKNVSPAVIVFKDGKARLLTDKNLIKELEEHKAAKKEEEEKQAWRDEVEAHKERKRNIENEKIAFKAMCQVELDKWQKDVEGLLAAGVKKRILPKKPMHWAKRKKPWNEEDKDLGVLDAKGNMQMVTCEELQN